MEQKKQALYVGGTNRSVSPYHQARETFLATQEERIDRTNFNNSIGSMIDIEQCDKHEHVCAFKCAYIRTYTYTKPSTITAQLASCRPMRCSGSKIVKMHCMHIYYAGATNMIVSAHYVRLSKLSLTTYVTAPSRTDRRMTKSDAALS